LSASSIFKNYAQIYAGRGFKPRPVPTGTKRSVTNWQVIDDEVEAAKVSSWVRKYPDYGIALAMGSVFSDGSRLGVLDIDAEDERFVRLAQALLGNPTCARFGARGLAIFVRVTAEDPNRNFVIKPAGGEPIKVGELLVDRKLCLIPPTIHPDGNPYRWVGTSLLDVNYSDLPLIED
jgi:hypothetical protein